MSFPEFQDLLLRYGEDPATWPEGTRDRAEALLLDSEEARVAQQEMRALRLALKTDPVKAPKSLAEDIVAKALLGTRDAARQQEPAVKEPAQKRS